MHCITLSAMNWRRMSVLGRAHRAAHANLSPSARHAHQHHVHDHDAADRCTEIALTMMNTAKNAALMLLPQAM